MAGQSSGTGRSGLKNGLIRTGVAGGGGGAVTDVLLLAAASATDALLLNVGGDALLIRA